MAWFDTRWGGERPAVLAQPLGWEKPRRILVEGLFHEGTPEGEIDRVFAVMALCPQHTFLVVDEGAERMRGYMGGDEARQLSVAAAIEGSGWTLPESDHHFWSGTDEDGNDAFGMYAWPLPNVQLGVPVKDQAAVIERIPPLLETAAARHWVLYEATGPVSLTGLWTRVLSDRKTLRTLDWVVMRGGERPMHPNWVRAMRDECVAAGVPFYFAGWGAWVPGQTNAEVTLGILSRAPKTPDEYWWPDHTVSFRVGSDPVSAMLDGREYRSWPGSTPDHYRLGEIDDATSLKWLGVDHAASLDERRRYFRDRCLGPGRDGSK